MSKTTKTLALGSHRITARSYDGPRGYALGRIRLFSPVIRVHDRPAVQVFDATDTHVATFYLPLMSIARRAALRDEARALGICAE